MRKKPIVIAGIVIVVAILLWTAVRCGSRQYEEEFYAKKPVIYLYPEQETVVNVQLEFDGELLCTYPAIEGGWNVLAKPDGSLVNLADGKPYYCLFWEGSAGMDYDMSQGFVVRGSDTAAFLQEKLSYLGLTPDEANEFIIYWLPQMEQNPYNFITFQKEAYTDHARLTITPEPDSVLRVFMAYKPLEQPINMPEQTLEPFTRTGFTVVEWGGAEVC